MNELDEIHDIEEKNYYTSKEVLGDSLLLVEDVHSLYRLLTELIFNSGIEPRDEIIAANYFMLACQYNLTIGMLALLRGHINDSFILSRKAIEQCAFAAKVKKNPGLATIWMQASRQKGTAVYKEYRREFSSKNIFPKDNPKLCELYNRYDICSKLSHPSLYSFTRQIDSKTSDRDIRIEFKCFQLSVEDMSEPARTFLWIVSTHFLILRVFEEILDEAINHDRKRWEFRFNAVEVKINIQRNKWKELILEYKNS